MNGEELTNVLEGAYSDWQRSIEMWQCIAALGIKPYRDGTQWCFLYGGDLQSGVCGFGETIYEAAMDFYMNIKTQRIIKRV